MKQALSVPNGNHWRGSTVPKKICPHPLWMVFTGLQTFRQPEGRSKEESNERAFFCVAILAFFPLQSSKRSHSVAPKPCDALSVAYASSSFVRAFLARRATTPSSSVCREGHCRLFQHSAGFASLTPVSTLSLPFVRLVHQRIIYTTYNWRAHLSLSRRTRTTSSCLPSEWPARA